VVLAIVACGVAALVFVRAQQEPLDQRLERIAGLKADAVSEFWERLRRNVGRTDKAAVCGMIAYPLRHDGATVTGAADCVARYDDIFTIAVRKAVGTQQYEELFVNQSGVMAGIGELWFAGTCPDRACAPPQIRIVAVNSRTEGLQPPLGKTLLSCSAAGQRIQVSADGTGGAELRVWRSGRAVGPPDVEILRAQPSSSPPSACGSRAWTFSDGTRTYAVGDLGCDASLAPPPMGSVGRVTLSTPGSPGTQVWCFE
jgi:hypothetical protein